MCGMRILLALVAVLALAAGLVGVAASRNLGPFDRPDPGGNVFADRALFTDPAARTLKAAARMRAEGRDEDAALLREMAAVPSGIWLTPEEYPPGSVKQYVISIIQKSEAADEVPVLVLYGIPDRDCSGGFSAGGLEPDTYRSWVQEAADAVTAVGATAVVVLEPDALASSVECGNREERVRLVGEAVEVLASAGVSTYVDAGHSDWVPAETMASMLEEVGIDRVRGFSTNVANYQLDADEVAYAERIDSALGGGTHWVIDRGRNGNGASEEWCNPSGRALGRMPGFVDDGTGLDAYLWVKPPAESDGTCNLGPQAGEVYLDQALAMARAAGW